MAAVDLFRNAKFLKIKSWKWLLHNSLPLSVRDAVKSKAFSVAVTDSDTIHFTGLRLALSNIQF